MKKKFKSFVKSTRQLTKAAVDTSRNWLILKLMKENPDMTPAADSQIGYPEPVDANVERFRQLQELISIRSDPPELQREIMRDIHAMDRRALEQTRASLSDGLTLEDIVAHRAAQDAIRLAAKEVPRPEETVDWFEKTYRKIIGKVHHVLSDEPESTEEKTS